MVWVMTVLCLIFPTMSMCAPRQPVGAAIKFTNCGPDVIKSVSLSPCTTPDMCVFKHGDNVTVDITFTSTGAAIEDVQTKVFGIVEGVPIPFPLPQSDGCQFCNLTCPLTQGQHSYSNTFPVLSTYPSIKLPVKWELNNKDTPILCFVFPMAISG